MISQRLKLFIPLIIFALFFAVFMTLENRMISGDFDPSELPSALIGKPMPAFSLPLLGDKAKSVNQAAIKGPALINVWATWCVSCRVEHAYLVELSKKGVSIIGLNYKDEREAALLWLERLGDPYRFTLYDEAGQLGLNMGVYGAPETYVVDANGVIQYRHVGVLNEKAWKNKIARFF